MPPRQGRGDLLQVLRPQQLTQSIREAHVHDHVPLSPVIVHDRTHHAAMLSDPMMLAHPYGRTDKDCFWLHEAPPATGRHNRGLVGFEGELLFSIYLSVLEIVGTGRDDLLGLLF